MTKRAIVVGGMALTLACANPVVFAAETPTAPQTQPSAKDKDMHQALHQLKLARYDLIDAPQKDVKQGKEKAQKQVDYAIEQIYAGLGESSAMAHDKEVEAKERAEAKAQPDHGLYTALKHLKEAQTHLTAAPHDYAGHRAKAQEFVAQAIKDVEAVVNAPK